MRQSTMLVAGIEVHTYTTKAFASSVKPILGLFLLHGRKGSYDSPHIQDLIKSLIDAAEGQQGGRDLLVIALDHRNHGKRLVNDVSNQDFAANAKHALDMYAIQSGTAKDCSFVMNLLEAYMFPSGERTIVEWGIAGVSLGGHSAWIAAATDPRFRICIPIIGCPDYLALMSSRAEGQGFSVGPPHFPESLLRLIRSEALDPLSFKGKNVLVLSGGSDPLVPWWASKKFVEALDVGDGDKTVILFEDAAHEVTPGMVQAAVQYVLKHALY